MKMLLVFINNNQWHNSAATHSTQSGK